MTEFDVAVIGAGPGGYVCGIRAAQLGLSTVVIEADRLGGECLNYGCIPSKSLITMSRLYGRLSEAGKFGVHVSSAGFDLRETQKWKGQVIERLTGGIGSLLKGNGAEVVMGAAEIVERNRVRVRSGGSEEDISARNIVIATGTTAIRLPGIPVDGTVVVTSKEALEFTSPPNHLLVIGGGVIGIEFACMYQKLGSEITIVELTDQLLPGNDPEVVRVVQRKLEAGGARVHLGSSVSSVSVSGGKARVEVKTREGTIQVEADRVLQSVGKRPVTEGLNLESLGVRTDKKGYIQTDNRMMTSVPGIYAIGDVRGPPLLAHKASREGLVAAEAIAGLPSVADWRVIPDAVFSDPEIATVGLTEARAIEAGYSVKKTRFPFASLGRALSTGETDGFVKVVSRAEDGLVLGVQIVGPEASNLISEAALAIEMGATVEDVALTIHPHPTLPEAIMEAMESASGRPIHQLKL